MFITFEGIEGSGKSTALTRLCLALEQDGRAYLRTREPGGSELGRSLRELLLDARQAIAPKAELFLYLADRAQHVSQVIKPALAGGALVLSDRYADSTIVYQGYGRGLDVDRLHALNAEAVGDLWPDVTVVFDLDPQLGLARARERNERLGTALSEGRFEAEHLDFHHKIRNGYLHWAAKYPQRFHTLDASRDPDEVFASLLSILAVKGISLNA